MKSMIGLHRSHIKREGWWFESRLSLRTYIVSTRNEKCGSHVDWIGCKRPHIQ